MMSLGIFVLMSSWLHDVSTRYTETSEILNNFGDLAEADIQIILQEDSAKYETAYSYLNDLYFLNDQYLAMVEYNITHPFNYKQQDFDEVKIEFNLKMRVIISIVQSTSVYDYGVSQLGMDVANNYTYREFEYYLIINQWNEWDDPHEEIHDDIRDYVNTSFTLSGDSLEIPEIKFEKWTYHLYNNLSVLEFVSSSKSIGYISIYEGDIDLNLVNLSLAQISEYSDGYLSLSEKAAGIIQDFNNTLITLALSGVLLGFATSFENINYRRISLVVGLLVLLLAIIYFVTALGTLAHLADSEALIIRVNEFVFLLKGFYLKIPFFSFS